MNVGKDGEEEEAKRGVLIVCSKLAKSYVASRNQLAADPASPHQGGSPISVGARAVQEHSLLLLAEAACAAT